MVVKRSLSFWDKLYILGFHSRYDVCSKWEKGEKNLGIPGIYYAKTSSGDVPLLKVLFTNYCSFNCSYCANRASRDRIKRVSFGVHELVKITQELYRKGLIRGLFLSSAVGIYPHETFIKMGEVARILRKNGFKGYIHLKILPFVPWETVKHYSKFANRVSYNLEAPTTDLLEFLSREKDLNYGEDILKRLGSFTTQFIVDYGKDKDLFYLKFIERLCSFGLKRAYFKAFEPIKDTPMEHYPSGSRMKEHRLYQAEFLIRVYGFRSEEIVGEDGKLNPHLDPKEYWAYNNPWFFPVDVTEAPFEELIRVPGIGIKTAKRILALRLKGELTADGLKKLLPFYLKSAKYIIFKGKRLEDCGGDKFRVFPLFFKTGVECL